MRFSPQFLDELRARLPVSEVVGRRVQLRKAGREWKGLSPFNKEKTPSFFVNDQKAMWFDFSSGKNGNIFDFVMLTEGVELPRGGRAAGRQAGVPLPVLTREARRARSAARPCTTSSSLPRNSSRRRSPRAPAPRRAAISPTAASIRRRRSSSGSAMRRPSDSRSRSISATQGISVEDMVEAGLLVAGDDIPVPYDRFRDRVMFPIGDLRGRVIAFGGRALDKEVAGEIPQLAGDAALPQGRDALQYRRRARRPPTRARR